MFPQSPAVQVCAALADPRLRSARQPCLHDLLPGGTVHGVRHENGTPAGAGNRFGMGYLRRDLLRACQQGNGAHHTCGGTDDGGLVRTEVTKKWREPGGTRPPGPALSAEGAPTLCATDAFLCWISNFPSFRIRDGFARGTRTISGMCFRLP